VMGFALSAFADDFGVVDVFDVGDSLGDLLVDARSEGPGHQFRRVRVVYPKHDLRRRIVRDTAQKSWRNLNDVPDALM
jgi:hypothetical protein